MNFLADPEFLKGLWKVIVADIILAGDNAVVIALAVRALPPRQKFWGRIFGALGAVVLRVFFVWIITYLLKVPFLQFAGGLALIWIAVKLVHQGDEHEEEEEAVAAAVVEGAAVSDQPAAKVKVRAGTTMFQAIWVIIVADIVMSFDNVMAISGASKGQMSLVIFGLIFSIPLVVLGSGILSDLMKRLPWLVWLGAGLLGHVAGHMLLEDVRVAELITPWGQSLGTWLPILLFLLITALGWWFARGTPRAQEMVVTPE